MTTVAALPASEGWILVRISLCRGDYVFIVRKRAPTSEPVLQFKKRFPSPT